MKKASYLLIAVCLLFINCKSVKHINGFGEEDAICRKYDVVNDITYVRDLSNFNDIRIKGKWKDSHRNLGSEYYISHCPQVENELGTLLELWIREYDKFEWKNKSDKDILIENFNEYATFWKNKNFKYSIIKSDIKASYYIYEVMEDDKRRIELMGINNKKYYRIAIYNFDPNQYISMEDFLIGIFTIN